MRRLVVLAIVAGTLVVGGRSALGCSCAYGDPRTNLARSDGALVGRLESKGQPTPGPNGTYSSAQPIRYTFLVERSVKGNLGNKVDVQAAAEGASCGLEVAVGERTGLFLHRDGDEWRSGLCSQIAPEALIEAAKPLPAPTSTGPVSLVVGGRYGPATAVALNIKGKTVAYGYGDPWDTSHISVCPGSRALVEWGYPLDGSNVPTLAVRSFDRFDKATARRIPELRDSEPDFNRMLAISCRDASGGTVFVAVSDYGSGGEANGVANGRIVRINGGRLTTLYEGTLQTAVFARSSERAYITGGRFGRDVMVVDLTSGRARRIARIDPDLQGISIDPTESRLAFTNVIGSPPHSFRMAVVDMSRSPAIVKSIEVKDSEAHGTTIWSDDETVLFLPGGGRSDRVQVFDHRLTRKGSFTGWHSADAVVVGGTLYGVGWGKLYAASLPNGPARTLRSFESPLTFALASVPAPQPVRPHKGPQAPAPTTGSPSPSATPTSPSSDRVLGAPVASGKAAPAMIGVASVLALVAGLAWASVGVRRRKSAP